MRHGGTHDQERPVREISVIGAGKTSGKTYGQFPALLGVILDRLRGQFLTLLERYGSGKRARLKLLERTLLMILGGGDASSN